MQQVEKAFEKNEEVKVLYLQTVFEGKQINSFEKGVEDIKRYGLKGPYGYDAHDERGNPITMARYRTGGTPWLVIIDPKGHVVFNDFSYEGETVEKKSSNLIKKLKELSQAKN